MPRELRSGRMVTETPYQRPTSNPVSPQRSILTQTEHATPLFPITVSNSSEQNINLPLTSPTMSATDIAYMPLKLASDMVPQFDGKSSSVEYFIKQCKVAEAYVKPGDKPLLKALIFSKIKGNAFDLTEGCYSDLTELLETLRESYSKVHDIDDIEDQIKELRQKPDEKISDFGATTKKILNLGVNFAESNSSSSNLSSVIDSLKSKAKKAFIKGIRSEKIKSRVSDSKPESLEMAIKIAMKIERESIEHAKYFPSDPKDIGTSSNNNDKYIKSVNKINSTPRSTPRTCYNCGDPGHIKMNCPLNNKQTDIKRIPMQCTRCKKKGHTIEKCLFKAREEGKKVCFMHNAIGHTCVNYTSKNLNSPDVPQTSAVGNTEVPNQRPKPLV